jgi:hypothetical protein
MFVEINYFYLFYLFIYYLLSSIGTTTTWQKYLQ